MKTQDEESAVEMSKMMYSFLTSYVPASVRSEASERLMELCLKCVKAGGDMAIDTGMDILAALARDRG